MYILDKIQQCSEMHPAERRQLKLIQSKKISMEFKCQSSKTTKNPGCSGRLMFFDDFHRFLKNSNMSREAKWGAKWGTSRGAKLPISSSNEHIHSGVATAVQWQGIGLQSGSEQAYSVLSATVVFGNRFYSDSFMFNLIFPGRSNSLNQSIQ